MTKLFRLHEIKKEQFINITTMRQVRLEVMTHGYDKLNENQEGLLINQQITRHFHRNPLEIFAVNRYLEYGFLSSLSLNNNKDSCKIKYTIIVHMLVFVA